ncbi:3-deoxy-manno-octulosonate cytidylyltransferase [Halovivax limisalsi]|uniref:3-deoxy-manno-octulosonate cytidylyltransferase n=1 Tax=Halovivax limisalsi TaxID=1453760 RepID=UPI001FFD12F3|nr:3-deoxy-manno-octulosonate cytidylyltransferase [Halovivax limisalsi]
MRVDAVIPVRMGSSRYPGKPLVDIEGFSMVEHVYRRTKRSDVVDGTYVATPDEEIREEAESFGAEVIVTGEHSRATDRVAEAAESLEGDIVIVMQGDEPLVYPEMIDAAVEPMLEDDSIDCVNLGKELESEAAFRDPNTVKVVVDGDWEALYFSREPIPNLHDTTFEDTAVYKQVCVLPFRREALFEFTSMAETPLERAESIDMLRLLENGRTVQIVETDRTIHAVDTPEDHERVNEMMATDELYLDYADDAK